MADKVEQLEFQNENQPAQAGPVTCLGMTFENDTARRAYFTEELKKKLPELRKIEGFPIGEDEDILALSDPPYYTACPNPWITDFIREWESSKPGIHNDNLYHREPFVADVSEGKNDPIYNMYSYHTKVPHKAIMRYILHYTNPGDIVFDGFSGTGMTGVAATLCGDKQTVKELLGEVYDSAKVGPRMAILNDLSPTASFVSYNYNNPVNADEFMTEFRKIIGLVEEELDWMFKTKVDGIEHPVNYAVWSDVFACPYCQEEIVYWDIAIDEKNKEIRDDLFCSKCNSNVNKRTLERVLESTYDEVLNSVIKQPKQVPILINYGSGKAKKDKKPDAYDEELLLKIKDHSIPYWIPEQELPDGDKTSEPIRLGITHAHHFYSKRNLYVMASFNEKIQKSKYKNLHLNILRSSLTYSNKMVKVNIPRLLDKGGIYAFGFVSGTFYIPSIQGERSLIDAIKNKSKSVLKNHLKTEKRSFVISTQSTTYINNATDNSVDYIFIDPPFGANLMYSELNYIWESWFKIFTNTGDEAIVNKSQNKNINMYKELMIDCFKEAYRLLKPGKWMTIEFSNSQASVWNAIQEAVSRAGFIVANVAVLDKKQGSFNAITSTTAVKQDLVISAYKPDENFIIEISNQEDAQSVWTFLKQHLTKLPTFLGSKGSASVIIERTPRVLFDRMVAYYVQAGLSVPISSSEFQGEIAQRFPMRDGMAFLESQVAEYDKKRILVKEFTQLSLFVSDENSAIDWLRQQLLKKPQTRQDLHPNFMKEIQHIAKHEILPELDVLLEQNFLKYEGDGEVPSQIHTYLSTDYKDLRNLSKNDPDLVEKAKDRWYVPDPNKQADLEKLREKSLLREFNQYVEGLSNSKKRIKQFRTEAIRVGFYKAWSEKNYQTIVEIGNRLPETILQEDEKLLRYFDNAQTKLGL
ncbi:DNA methyltransferase [Brevibacillus centrosporus]|uniref:DNA methyltransferase n=1 Tax=Brevibacillus centrosporus TaxID=54910 RepID=UPI000F09B0F9|nr:DNA methyltransferase [Brevibacillus centrosporus]MEC2130246.1 DNA methyltransferase [Brevibacillus centrosporus]RNB70962.1 DNA methylase [Brevibacillus centrosporus]GED30276.1 DNA methylase [Brevibacillus centrosporus]